MPARTAKGRRALAEIIGLKEYVRVGAWRQKYYEDYGYFEKVLPYTIAFGLTDKFIKAFKNLDIKNLSWYEGSNLSSANFSRSINNFDSSFNSGINSTRPKSASSGGSGFSGGSSGGGFGGGGGGSW